MTEILEQTLLAYNTWLDQQPLAAKTRTAYRFQVYQYGTYLAQRPPTADDPSMLRMKKAYPRFAECPMPSIFTEGGYEHRSNLASLSR